MTGTRNITFAGEFFNSSKPAQIIKKTNGITFKFPKGEKCNENDNYQITFDIECSHDEEINTSGISVTEGTCNYNFNVKTKHGCVKEYYFDVTDVLNKMKFIFGPGLIIVGVILLAFGSKFPYVTIFIITASACVLLLLNLIFGFANIQSPILVYSFIAGGIVIGLVLAFIIILKEQKNIFGYIIGGVLGFVATGLSYNILLKFIYSNASVVYWLTMIVCVVGLSIFGVQLYDHLITLGTASIGAYAVIRGVALMIGQFLSESIVLELIGRKEFEELNVLDGYYIYLYLLGWALLLGAGYFLQKYVFKKEVGEEKEKPNLYEQV